jgi:hypothetical protein
LNGIRFVPEVTQETSQQLMEVDHMAKRNNGTARNHFGFLLGCCGAAALVLTVSGAQGRSVAARSVSEAASQAGASQTAKPSLAGTWKLNKDQSDDPRQKMQQAMRNSGGNQGEGNGNGSAANGGARPGRGGGGQAGGMMNEFAQLTVTQLDANVKITGASGRVLATTAPPDSTADSKSDSNASNGGGQRGDWRRPPVAQWQGSQLVTTGRGFGGGDGTTRTYELSPDGKQLYVTTKIMNERLTEPVSYRLVYDSDKSGGSNQ